MIVGRCCTHYRRHLYLYQVRTRNMSSPTGVKSQPNSGEGFAPPASVFFKSQAKVQHSDCGLRISGALFFNFWIFIQIVSLRLHTSNKLISKNVEFLEILWASDLVVSLFFCNFARDLRTRISKSTQK